MRTELFKGEELSPSLSLPDWRGASRRRTRMTYFCNFSIPVERHDGGDRLPLATSAAKILSSQQVAGPGFFFATEGAEESAWRQRFCCFKAQLEKSSLS